MPFTNLPLAVGFRQKKTDMRQPVVRMVRILSGEADGQGRNLQLGLAAVAGDLFESLLKRATGMKDSSAVVPGMGGVLDVIDSLLFGAPVLYYYVRFVLS